jgi:hypothetical protein
VLKSIVFVLSLAVLAGCSGAASSTDTAAVAAPFSGLVPFAAADIGGVDAGSTVNAICCAYIGETDELQVDGDLGYEPPALLVRCSSLPPGCAYFSSGDVHCPLALALGISQAATCFPAQ